MENWLCNEADIRCHLRLRHQKTLFQVTHTVRRLDRLNFNQGEIEKDKREIG